MKVHVHEEQFDGAWHTACGRGADAVSTLVFEATPHERRCRLCERHWFPFGGYQPDWHHRGAQQTLREQLSP